MGKKPMEHPDYQIKNEAGEVIGFSLTKWSRENVPKEPLRFKPGDEAVYVTTVEIIEAYRDCDGSPLYQIDRQEFGIWQDSLRELPKGGKDWKCEQCGAVIGTVTERGLRCDPLPQLRVHFRGMTGWVRCECGHDNAWHFSKELMQDCLLDKLDYHRP